MKRKIALAVGLGVLLLVSVALAYRPAPCPDCGDTTTTRAFYTCLNPNHTPVFTTQPAYYEPENGRPFPPPMDWPCPICGTLCVADSADCTNPTCFWRWYWQP